MDKPNAWNADSKGYCHGSSARVFLTGLEDIRRAARCAVCGRLLKVRPVIEDNNEPVATLPRHKPGK